MGSALRAGVFDGGMMSDENARLGAAYLESTRKMNESGEVETSGVDISAMEIMTGKPISQFEATFFLVAFGFCFPYSIGGPDLKNQARDRPKASPVVDFETTWSALMSQRVEGQFQRDSTFIFAMWNLVFRTIVNIGSNFSAIQNFKRDNQDPSSVCEAAVLIMRCLHGKYTSANGNELQVDGDLQKVHPKPIIHLANNPSTRPL